MRTEEIFLNCWLCHFTVCDGKKKKKKRASLTFLKSQLHPLYIYLGIPCQRMQWHPTPVLLPGKSHGQRSLVGWVHGVTKSQTWLSNFTFTFHFHALEKEMATQSTVLAWRIPGTGEPDGLPSMGSHRVRHDWSNLTVAGIPCKLVTYGSREGIGKDGHAMEKGNSSEHWVFERRVAAKHFGLCLKCDHSTKH